jgi:hypothetical protein
MQETKSDRIFLLLNSPRVFGILFLWRRLYRTGRGKLVLEDSTKGCTSFLKDILSLVLESCKAVSLLDFQILTRPISLQKPAGLNLFSADVAFMRYIQQCL